MIQHGAKEKNMILIKLIGFIIYLVIALIIAPLIAWLMVIGTLGQAWKRIVTQVALKGHKGHGTGGVKPTQEATEQAERTSTQQQQQGHDSIWYPYGGGNKWN